jgi:hypothetical protein
MKWSYLLTAGAFVGVFSLGAMFTPINTPSAIENQQVSVNGFSVDQTANEKDSLQPEQGEITCPMTGEPMGQRAGRGMMGGMMGSMNEVISKELGLTTEEFQAASLEGKTIAEMAEEKGITVKELVKAVVESRKSELNQLVKDGKLTQEQMDNMLKNMETRMEQSFEQNNTGPMNGRGMGMGQRGKCIDNTEIQQSQTGTEL